MIEEKLTPAIRQVKKAFTEKLKLYPDKFFFGCIHYVIIKEAMKEIGFEPDWNNYSENHSGGDLDYWIIFRNNDKNFSYLLSASLMEASAKIEKKPKDYEI